MLKKSYHTPLKIATENKEKTGLKTLARIKDNSSRSGAEKPLGYLDIIDKLTNCREMRIDKGQEKRYDITV